MQAASREIEENLTIDDLVNLGNRISLPSGWTYRVRITDELEIYEVRGEAVVLQDELKNTYQKILNDTFN